MSQFTPAEKGVPIRFPSTANLLIDSQDRYNYAAGNNTAGSFTIQKNNSILNGFFTRIAPTEVVLKWSVPNVYDLSGGVEVYNGGYYNPAVIRVDISGVGASNVTIAAGLYTVGECLDSIVRSLNTPSLGGATFSITRAGNVVTLSSTVPYRFPTAGQGNTIGRLGFGLGGAYVSSKFILNNVPPLSSGQPQSSEISASLQEYEYLDFVSSQLTYNQELKDASTDPVVRDVLFRWYLADEYSNYVDQYGFPIYQSYLPFCVRRPIAFPKQIAWSNSQPIGQLQFEVYARTTDGLNTVLFDTGGYDWGMTLLVSEV
jgi:hypothetical protein